MPEVTTEETTTPAHGVTPRLARASRPTQAVVILALAAAAAYLTWRWGWTLGGSSLWIGIPLVVTETYGFTMLLMLAFSCWRLSDRETPPPLEGRTVAVLIATFDEDEDVLRPTVVGSLAIRNDVDPEVWVLDDGGRPWVEEMCRDLGAHYLSRPAPRTHAKAGNINHALEHVSAEFVVTLDADHVPRPELIERMLGHMADPRVAVVQAPQAFYNRGFGHPRAADDDPMRNEQSIFFDVICRGKDRHGAAFWCGCPSLIRREALMEVGGVATDTVVEDAHTSLKMNARGWRVVYHHEVMALGLAPEEIGAFVVQRGRWARGSLQMLRLDTPLFKRGLTWRQRIEYSASCLHFLEGPQRLIGLLVPGVVLATGAVPIDANPALYLAVFLPQLILIPTASKALTRGHYRVLEGERYSVVRIEAYLRAMAALPRGRGGGFKVTPKGARAGGSPVARALRVPIAVGVFTVAAIGYQTAAQILDLPGRLSAGASTFTTLWALVNVALITYVVLWARGVHHRRRSHRFPVAVHAAYAADGDELASLAGRLADLSRHGARLWVGEERTVGEALRLVLLLDEGPMEVSGRVATITPDRAGDGWMLGVDFDGMDAATADAIVAWCFRHPFGAEGALAPPVPALVPDREAVEFSNVLAEAQMAATVEPGDAPAVDGDTPAP
jgi:cellulose synthase/poly-beta-1,6-N-acetylglucosamine synthase-like glycosyltransferase